VKLKRGSDRKRGTKSTNYNEEEDEEDKVERFRDRNETDYTFPVFAG